LARPARWGLEKLLDRRPSGMRLLALAIRKLVSGGDLQLSLFDQQDLAEITAPKLYPGERLIVCRNLLLAAERGPQARGAAGGHGGQA